MVLWADKYRPTQFEELALHHSINQQLLKLVKSGDFPHFLFYGPPGSGKKTRVTALLRQLYGNAIETVKINHQTIQVNNKIVPITTLGSEYHVEMTPSDVGKNDLHVIQELIKNLAQKTPCEEIPCRVLVLYEVDRLSKEAQYALRRTMEKYTDNCRIILVCESITRILEPLKSRCLPIRVAAPSIEEIITLLLDISIKEIIHLPQTLAKRIAEQSNRNARKAILMLEACKINKYPFDEDQQVHLAEWEKFVDDLAQLIIERQDLSRLTIIRASIYELLTNFIPPHVILKTLTQRLLTRINSQQKSDVVHYAAYYEHRMKKSNKPFRHLEAFVAKSYHKTFIFIIGNMCSQCQFMLLLVGKEFEKALQLRHVNIHRITHGLTLLLHLWNRKADSQVIETVIEYDKNIKQHEVMSNSGRVLLLDYLIETKNIELLRLVLTKGHNLFESEQERRSYKLQAKNAGMPANLLVLFDK